MDSNSGILSENTKANYTERYDSLLKMKNHVNKYKGKPLKIVKNGNVTGSFLWSDDTNYNGK